MKKLTKVKALIRYNQLDGKTVAYYKQGGRFFKMLDSKQIRPMGKCINHVSILTYHWTTRVKVQLVYEDEQLLFNDSPVDIDMDTFQVNTKTLNV